MRILKIGWAVFRSTIIAALLTLITQTGGVIYLLAKPLGLAIKRKNPGWRGTIYRMTIYAGVYLSVNLILVPLLAKQYDRMPLPWQATSDFPTKPARYFYCLANRHYVRTDLYQAFAEICRNIQQRYPGTELAYLDANFPLFDYFPLLPHKSHNDGRRLDINFLYVDAADQRLNHSPTLSGYGYCEIPKKGEVDWPERCRKKGYRLYSMLYNSTRQLQNDHFRFDEEANRQLLKEIADHRKIRKIFIEPHLKTRLRLQLEHKIRFHGCAAVRHDDHIHLEM